MKGRLFLYLGLFVLSMIILAACASEGPAGPQGPPGPQGDPGPSAVFSPSDVTCTQCHNDTSLITGKHYEWAESAHGSGDVFSRYGTRLPCASCHSGSTFSERIAAGLNPDEVESAVPDATRQDCRACHQIHTTFTRDDFALETTDPVDLYSYEGVTYDGGDGNLCVNCHQARRDAPVAEEGVVSDISEHWGPHHGPQSSMLLGIGGTVEGSPSPHYLAVEDTCVGCHMGPERNHTYEPTVERCQACHPDAEDFDIEGVQTQVQALLDELGDRLVAEGVLSENGPDGHPTVEEAPENVAFALWNWIYVAHEDGSLGVHNSDYTIALLEAGLEALGQ